MAEYILIRIIDAGFDLFEMLLVLRAIMSWFVQNPYSQARGIYEFLVRATEPVLRPCRDLLNRFVNTGMFDFSIILAFALLAVIKRILIYGIAILL